MKRFITMFVCGRIAIALILCGAWQLCGGWHYSWGAEEPAAAAPPAATTSPSQTASAAEPTTDNTLSSPEELPPALEAYKGRTIAQTMHYAGAPWLTRENREREEECSTLLKTLKLQPGQVVCDMGCGNGFYALKIAPTLGEKGKVLCVDIQSEMLKLLAERAKEENISNYELILGSPIDPRLPAGKVDLILCVDVYHEFSHPEQMLAAMRRSLAPGGRLVLVEFRLEDPNVPIKELHKMSKKQILKELEPNGFKLVEQFDKLPWQHVMFFEADPQFQPTPAPPGNTQP
ncbi:MAG: class I SAM-dependent methyltransferase [Pirellulales bacterium]|nr:class I SAM-dependent methyltransferase [Pirellulales bacterium]